MSVLEGRQVVGRWGGVVQKQKKKIVDGVEEFTTIPGFYEVQVWQEGRQFPHRMVFFAESDGEVTRMQHQTETADPQVGDLVSVRFKTTPTISLKDGKPYANDEATGVVVIERASADASSNGRDPRTAAA